MKSQDRHTPEPPDDQASRYELFVTLFTRHEAGLRAFVRSLLPGWDAVDEVMQNTGLVLWRKFHDFDPDTEFMRWACVVARFEVLAWRRDKARDRHVFDPDLVDLLAAEAEDSWEALSRERRALERCLARLPESRRRLVIASYEPGVKIHEVAALAGKTATAFYKLLNRIRAALLDCVKSEIQSPDSGGALKS